MRYSQSLNDILPRSKNERTVLNDRLRKRLSGDEDEARLSIRSRSELNSLLGGLGGENDGGGGRVGLFRVTDEEGAGEGVDLEEKEVSKSGKRRGRIEKREPSRLTKAVHPLGRGWKAVAPFFLSLKS